MDTIFMNWGNSKTPNSHGLLLNSLDKIDLKRSDKYVPFSNLSINYIWRNIKKSYKSNKCKNISSHLKWEFEFELSDGLYSVSDIQDYFEYHQKPWKM